MFLVAEAMVEEEMVLAVSGFLVKRWTIPYGSVTLDEEKKAALSSGVSIVT